MDMERFMEEGGTEMAPMSTTKSEKVAKQYGPRSHPSILLRISSRLVIKFFTWEFPACTRVQAGNSQVKNGRD